MINDTKDNLKNKETELYKVLESAKQLENNLQDLNVRDAFDFEDFTYKLFEEAIGEELDNVSGKDHEERRGIMTSKIYTKTFIKVSEEAITKIDDHLAFVEDGIGELNVALRKLTKGNTKNLLEQSKTNVSDYQDGINRMSICLSDLYSLKNDLLDELEKLKNNNN